MSTRRILLQIWLPKRCFSCLVWFGAPSAAHLVVCVRFGFQHPELSGRAQPLLLPLQRFAYVFFNAHYFLGKSKKCQDKKALRVGYICLTASIGYST